MRTPVEAVHFGVLGCEALCKLVIMMIFVIPARGISGRQQDDDSSPDKCVPPLRRCLAGIVALLLTFSAFFRHDVFYITVLLKDFQTTSPMQPVLCNRFYATTLSAPGNTSSSSQCKVRTSPSTITSTGASRAKVTRRTALCSASGCSR